MIGVFALKFKDLSFPMVTRVGLFKVIANLDQGLQAYEQQNVYVKKNQRWPILGMVSWSSHLSQGIQKLSTSTNKP